MALSNITSKLNLHLRNIRPLKNAARNIVSALHVAGNKPKATVSILTPSLDHIDKLLANGAEFKRNLEVRGCEMNVESFGESWRYMKELQVQMDSKEEEREQVSRTMRQLKKTDQSDTEATARAADLKSRGKELREQLKEIMKVWWEVEEKAVVSALKIPNSLHPKTPQEEEEYIIRSFKTLNQPQGPAAAAVKVNHQSSGDVEFVDHSPTAYYLKGPLAELELYLQRMFTQGLVSEGFHLVSAPDFVKSLIVDGCGMDFTNGSRVLTLSAVQGHGGSLDSGNALHLVGGASLPAMVALLTKSSIQSALPLRMVASGRHYDPSDAGGSPRVGGGGLFSAVQSTCVRALSVLDNNSSNADALYEECQHMERIVGDLLTRLDVHFRMCATPGRRLQPWEQYRASFQLYSPSLEQYVQVADVSIVGDYISRRLAIYGPEGRHPAFVSATVLSAAKLIACLVENGQNAIDK